MKLSFTTTLIATFMSAAMTVTEAANKCNPYGSVITVLATSPTPEGLDPAVEGFEDLFGGVDNNNTIGRQPDGYRTINWDGAAGPFVMPPDAFHINVPRGLELLPSPATQKFLQSNDAAGVDDLFDSINPQAAQDFITFSPPRLFASQGSHIFKIVFHEAGSGKGAPLAGTKGFGAVFVDVDVANKSRMVVKDWNGCVIAEQYAQAQPNGLSFVGIFIDKPEIYSVEIVLPTDIEGKRNGRFVGGADWVVLDDFVYGEPTYTA